MKLDLILSELKWIVAKDYNRAVEILIRISKNDRHVFNDCIRIKGQINQIGHENLKGTSSPEYIARLQNRIVSILLDLIDSYEERDILPGVQFPFPDSLDDIVESGPNLGENNVSVDIGDYVILPELPQIDAERIEGSAIDWKPGMSEYLGNRTLVIEIDEDGSARVQADKGRFWWAFEWLTKE
jgi:hypothetical protein